jgi:hypothetical protein
LLTENFYDIYLLFQPFYLKTERHSASQSKLSDLGNKFDWSKNQFVHFDFCGNFWTHLKQTLRYIFPGIEAYVYNAPFFSQEGYVVFCNEINDNFENRYLSVL